MFVLLGVRSSGGYQVRVERVIPDGAGISVEAVESAPAPLSVTTTALTAPYQAITVPRFDGSAGLALRTETNQRA